MKWTVYSVLDRLIQKPVSMEFDDETLKKLKHGDKIIYTDSDNKEYVGDFLGYETNSEKSWKFKRILEGKEREKFTSNITKAEKLYTSVFLPIFEKNFPEAKPICARISIHGNYIYFYFCSNKRLDFSSLIQTFRKKLSMRFFIYQVNPRDRVRLHPNLDERYDANGLPLSYHMFKHWLDNVPWDALDIQGLRGRQIEKMKDWSGMLDHSLSYEYDFYKEESKKYPKVRSKVIYNNKKYLCIKCNYLTQDIVMRWEDPQNPGEFYGEYLTIHIDEYTILKNQEQKISQNKNVSTKKSKKNSYERKPRKKPVSKNRTLTKTTNKKQVIHKKSTHKTKH